ncbi:MAG: peptidoglycan DD-metalloendopeptidase family protein [Deltaproteobacteria bacterium]|nr:peptidoglycan DD-metalloendopeptidase family protein [Deltaproteobacteria bacterium]
MALDPLQSVLPLGAALEQPARPGSREDAAKQFEALYAHVLVKEMRKAMPKGGLFSGQGTEMWQDLLDEEMAKALVAQGKLGLNQEILSTMREGTAGDEAPLPPTPVSGARVSSTFGWRQHPISGEPDHHDGVDFAAPRGSPIRSVAAGVVRSATELPGYGKVVIIDHGDGLETRYAHCDSFSVQEGDSVLAGEVIAGVGSTGNSTGPHLHFEVRKRGKALDPQDWLNRSGSKR